MPVLDSYQLTAAGAVMRLLLPILAVVLLVRLGHSLLFHRNLKEVWAWLILPDGKRLAITHWENTLGSRKSCDLCLKGEKISPVHAVLTRMDDGTWVVTDADSKKGIVVGGKKVQSATVKYGQNITLGDVKVKLEPFGEKQQEKQTRFRQKEGGPLRPFVTIFTLTAFQICLMTASLASAEEKLPIFLCAMALVVGEWGLFFLYRIFHRKGFEVESVAFFLCSVGQCVVASSAPNELYKQTATIFLGVGLFLLVGWMLRNQKRIRWMRPVAAVGGLALLIFTLLFAKEVNGARNWVFLGGMSFQPSELAKICFVFVGTASLDTLVTRKNLLFFVIYTGAVCLCLALLSDFGTALVFFVCFLVIAFLRSGNFAAVTLTTAAAAFGGMLATRFLPYITRRFESWRHVWEHALTGGYQQTRSMMCIASGGLLGLGAGQGWLKYVAAADTDLVFAFVSEELGLIFATLMVLYVVLLGVYVVRSAPLSRGCFQSIGACAAVSILLTQTILNVFGTVDLLPLTGVTFPFVSNGGSSMLSAWGLLAFLKAVDTRQNASFTVPRARRDDP
ncbi:MAG: FtsW/RodA/SpoVE family cell cycle protein [Oscillospiraceae bacterium]|nr:FtsW/RodA/SpoVE family cell cycle protein [Oscillospiraceae bacterium]